MIAEGKVGPQVLGDGAPAAIRLARDGAAVLSPYYRELARRGMVFGAVTAASGVAPGTSIGTTGALDLYNPSGSPVDLEIIRVSVGYLSGTLGAGTIQYISHVRSEVAHTGTPIVPINARGFGQGGYGRPLTTATVPAAGLAIRNLCSLGASLASTAGVPWIIVDRVEGEIVVSEGRGVSLQGTTASGSTPLVLFEVLWAEIPVNL